MHEEDPHLPSVNNAGMEMVWTVVAGVKPAATIRDREGFKTPHLPLRNPIPHRALTPGRIRILSVGILLPNLAVTSVDQQLRAVPPGDLTPLLNGLLLGGEDLGSSLAPRALYSPATVPGDDMLVLPGHETSYVQNRTCTQCNLTCVSGQGQKARHPAHVESTPPHSATSRGRPARGPMRQSLPGVRRVPHITSSVS